ncbi:dihydroneopterin aldolase [Roseospira marina]|uniref:7,8-dihydroneopterin aldolase n=1 Tax=Roseospira marina TaxID=140057 RepID=A0A5M6IHG4_9PROT|nr:dihydroneopterin aldolase [Roseospira marina]KAA5607219.1 dihydroneopterin aldolase [Roseospira marina]MBB4312631.1 dihydroneopterin aldolase [Roseospira marina]MBB5085353.1 dihydroneopterin aldolase [Roseospira marina]
MSPRSKLYTSPPVAPMADAENRLRHVFVRDLVLHARIGVYDHEKVGHQRIRLNLDLSVRESAGDLGDRLENVVCYETVLNRVRALALEGHVNLVETLAERIADACLEDSRVRRAQVRVEKLDVFPDAESVGVTIERLNPFG